MVSVVMIGATGAVGAEALRHLLTQADVSRITVLGRRAVQADSPKLVQHVIDLEDPAAFAPFVAGHDVAICTLGVGQPTKAARDEFLRVDQAIPLAFGRACRAAGVGRFVLLSSVGAKAGSPSFYLRAKGELEAGLEAMGFDGLSLCQPSMILTPTNRYGLSQAITLAVWPWLGAVLPKALRGIKVADLGRAIANTARMPVTGVERLTWAALQVRASS
jgi:uncharacterized protein YbjT (DUF2867 family)